MLFWIFSRTIFIFHATIKSTIWGWGMKVIDIENTTWKITVGRLTSTVIQTLNLGLPEKDIVVWHDRIGHFRKHLDRYSSEEEFEQCINRIPEVIADPDYVALHPSTGSIEYIKMINVLFIVAVRLKTTGDLNVRSAYPLTNRQLADYIASGTAKKM